MVLTLMSRKSLEAEEVVAHAVVRVGNLHPYPAFGAESHSVMDRQKFSKECGHLELQSGYAVLPGVLEVLRSSAQNLTTHFYTCLSPVELPICCHPCITSETVARSKAAFCLQIGCTASSGGPLAFLQRTGSDLHPTPLTGSESGESGCRIQPQFSLIFARVLPIIYIVKNDIVHAVVRTF